MNLNYKKKRRARTIPFGYKLSGNYLIPINLQLVAFEKIKKEILSGVLSPRKASQKLEIITKRKISHIGIRKRLDKEYPNWREKVKASHILIKEQKAKHRKWSINYYERVSLDLESYRCIVGLSRLTFGLFHVLYVLQAMLLFFCQYVDQKYVRILRPLHQPLEH